MFLRRFRPMMRIEKLVLVVVAWMVVALNGPWWAAAGAGRDWMSLVTSPAARPEVLSSTVTTSSRFKWSMIAGPRPCLIVAT